MKDGRIKGKLVIGKNHKCATKKLKGIWGKLMKRNTTTQGYFFKEDKNKKSETTDQLSMVKGGISLQRMVEHQDEFGIHIQQLFVIQKEAQKAQFFISPYLVEVVSKQKLELIFRRVVCRECKMKATTSLGEILTSSWNVRRHKW